MYARLTSFQLPPERFQDFLHIYEQQFLPAARSSWTGFRDAYLLGDERDGDAAILLFWNTREDVQAIDESGEYAERLHLFESLIDFPPVTDDYQVFRHPADSG